MSINEEPRMPEPPDTSVITHHFFESPLLLTTLLAVAGVALIVAGFRTGRRKLMLGGLGAGVAILALLLVERSVITAGEHAVNTTRRLIAAVEDNNVDAAMSEFDDNALLALGSPQNPGESLSTIRRSLEAACARYQLERVKITSLRSYTVERDEAEVHLRVSAWSASWSGFPSRSAWVLRVRRDATDAWKVKHVTCIEIDGNPPGMSILQ